MASVSKRKKASKVKKTSSSSSGISTVVSQLIKNPKAIKELADEMSDELEDVCGYDEDELVASPEKLNQSLNTLVQSDKAVEEVLSDLDEEDIGVDWTQYTPNQKRQILAGVSKSPQFRQALINELND